MTHLLQLGHLGIVRMDEIQIAGLFTLDLRRPRIIERRRASLLSTLHSAITPTANYIRSAPSTSEQSRAAQTLFRCCSAPATYANLLGPHWSGTVAETRAIASSVGSADVHYRLRE